MTTKTEKQRLDEEGAVRFFKYFAEKSRTVFWVRDPKGEQQLYVSPAYEKVFGRSTAELYANPGSFAEIVAPEDRSPNIMEMRLQHMVERGPDAQYERRFRIVHPNGSLLWIKDTSFPIYDDEGVFIGFAGIGEDITQDVLREQELRDAMQRAEEANAAKSDFLAMMSHELRTPLNAILGMAQILRMKGVDPELEECVDIIAHAGNSLLALVSDILDFSKLEVGKLTISSEPVDLQLLVSQVMFSMQHQAQEKGVALTLDYPETVPNFILSDANRLRQILSNLIGNAIKFTDRGGVKIEMSFIEKNNLRTKLKMDIIDTGLGISSDKLDYIFEKFSQIDSIYQRKHQGTGLGLAITKELIERMGGKIEVVSELGKGSCFTVLLPFQLQQSCLIGPIKKNISLKNPGTKLPALKSLRSLKILLVEDNIINQKIAKIMLEELGCHVTIMDNGEKVLAETAHLSHYDLIFMDIGLPDMSGFELVDTIRKQALVSADVPIIAMTAHVLERDRKHCFEVGMNAIIAKPIAHDELVATLQYWTKPVKSY